MFEKRLKSFSYAAGMTFLILILTVILTFCWYMLLDAGYFGNITIISSIDTADIAGYLLNLKLLTIFFGALFLLSYIWHKKLTGSSC